MKDYALLALAWVGWCLLHSLLAATWLTGGPREGPGRDLAAVLSIALQSI